jgi:hypothetical protein
MSYQFKTITSNPFFNARLIRKDKVFSELQDVYAAVLSNDDIKEREREAILQSIAKIASAFIPSSSAKPKDNFSWVRQAVSKKEFKRPLMLVNVGEGRIAGSNGFYVLIAPNDTGMPDGLYEPKTKELARCQDLIYPNYKQVIPTDETKVEVTDKLGTTNELGKRPTITRFLSNGAQINEQFYQNTIALGLPDKMYMAGELDPLLMKWNDGKVAVIMPMRIK